ncbi:MAG: hypothetical protein ABFD89_08490, partial [Bryobacteraceae bacterium]
IVWPAAATDLSNAVVVAPATLRATEKKAVEMLVEEVEKRTQVRWEVVQTAPAETKTFIGIGQAAAGRYSREVSAAPKLSGAEGYRILSVTGHGAPAVFVLGNDPRGTLFGVGKLLRNLRMRKGAVELPDGYHVASAPKYRLRGHQLGYRPKTNSYDAWTPAMWEQYIRDLAVFGTNAVELIPPRSDDDVDSPHFPLPPMEMMTRMSKILADYGLDVWIWYPALDPDYSYEKAIDAAVKEWGEVFKRLPRVDAIFVPGGDPGHTPPRQMMTLLARQAENLRRYHPKAQWWLSPQGFRKEWMDEFLTILKNEQPAWLTGVVYGPQAPMPLPELRKAVPERYLIRHYPDITHSFHCQFPVPDWDVAYAATEARESINPRPLGEANIFRRTQPLTIGFLSYSEGCNDDVNKIVWSGLGWDPDKPVIEILRDYSRYFIGEPYADSFAQGLLALERNWKGPLAANRNVETTLAQFQAMERAASPADLLNWRFQQARYRAYYDAYTRSRLIYETELEDRAMDRLRSAHETGSLAAMREAEEILAQADRVKVAHEWRSRVFELAEALYQSVRMQLSVPRYKAIDVGRGANLDTLDVPLNSRLWLVDQFAELRAKSDEAARLRGINEIVNWTNPGSGGFYDDPGDPSRQPHVVRGMGDDEDPQFWHSSLVGFRYDPRRPRSWWHHAEALYESPLEMRYTDLDPAATYKVRVVYAGDAASRKIRMLADGVEVHPLMEKPKPVRPLEFDIPPSATSDGKLTLQWYREPGIGGNGRGAQVSEIWLMRK